MVSGACYCTDALKAKSCLNLAERSHTRPTKDRSLLWASFWARCYSTSSLGWVLTKLVSEAEKALFRLLFPCPQRINALHGIDPVAFCEEAVAELEIQ